MSVYSKFLELQSGSARTVDLSTNTLSVQGLQINAATGGGAITFAAHSATTPYTIVWPQAQAASSGYVLTNDGSGNLSWAATSSPLVFADSLVNTSGTVTLVNDSATPGDSMYYGTNSGGTLGYYSLPVSGINQLTGDVTAGPGTGSQVATLATVNSDVGSFGSSTSIPSFTVNGKGLITAASGNAVIAPAGTLSGTTLNSTVVSSSLTSLGTQSQALNMGSNQINDLASPSVSTDAATKGYVDSAINGLTWKGPVQAYANSNVPLTGSTPLVIDGHTVQNNDLLLLGNQTTASQNGEYTAAVSGGSYTLTANGQPTAAGDAWLVLDGTTYANSAFVATAAVPSAAFVEFAGPTAYTFTAPLMLSGNTVSITQASSSSNGYLSSTDWNTFNNKQPAGNYITALTGDVSASGPGSAAATLATVNSNVGSFTYASITVNAKGLVTAASNGTAPVTSISVASANGLAGSSSGGSTPTLTLSTTINSPVLAGNGTAISAATTTGSGSTVVLSASPTLSGTVSAANVSLSGNLVAPTTQLTATYNGAATLSANTTYAVRWGIPANSETAGEFYLADWNTASFDLFWVVGLYNNTSSTSTGASITVTVQGNFTLGSSDTVFGSADQGKPVWLGSSGAYIANSGFSPSSGDANFKMGIVTGASTIWIDRQMMGVS